MNKHEIIADGVRTGVWHMRAVPTIHEFVGVPLGDMWACGLLCQFRPGLVAKTYEPPDTVEIKRRESKQTFLIRYPDKIVRMDAEVTVEIVPRKMTREELREFALEVCCHHEPQCPDATEEGTPEFYDVLCNVERALAHRYRESGAEIEYDFDDHPSEASDE